MARIPKIWYRKERKTWCVTIRGTRHNLGADKKEAVDRFHQLMGKPDHKPAKSMSFVAVADSFLDWLKSHRADGTFDFYHYRVERFCQRYPNLQLADIRPFHCQQWVDSYPDLARTTRRNYLRSIRRCVNWAHRQGFIAHDPLKDLEMPSGERREVCITKDQFGAMLKLMSDEWFQKLCIVAFETGCRPQEIRRVEARHFDAVHSRWVFPVKESKGKRQPRIVYLTPKAEEITKELILQYPEGPLFRNGRGRCLSQANIDAAFLRLQREMATQVMLKEGTTLQLAVKEELKRRGDTRSWKELSDSDRKTLSLCVYAQFAPKYCLYVLRHSFATAALQSGLDGLTVGVLLGHNDPSMLARVYMHLSHNPEHLLGQMRKTIQK